MMICFETHMGIVTPANVDSMYRSRVDSRLRGKDSGVRNAGFLLAQE